MNNGRELLNAMTIQSRMFNLNDEIKSLSDKLQCIVSDTDIKGELTFTVDDDGLISVCIEDDDYHPLIRLPLSKLLTYMTYHSKDTLTRDDCRSIYEWLINQKY